MFRSRRRIALLLAFLLVPTALLALATPGAADHSMSFAWVKEGKVAVGDGRLTGSDAETLKGRGIGAVLNLLGGDGGDDVDAIKARGLEYRHIAVNRPEEIDFVTLVDGLAWMKEQVAAGRPVYVHCEVINRTSVFTVAYLMETEHLRLSEATQRLAAAGVRFNLWDPEILLRFEARLFGEPKLNVFLSSNRAVASPGEELNVQVAVKAPDGSPVAASVQVRSGTDGPRDLAVGDTGRATFTWHVAERDCWPNQCFLEVRATRSGYVMGSQRVLVPRPEYGDINAPYIEAPATQVHAIENGVFPVAFNLRGTLSLAVPVEVIGPDGRYATTLTGGAWDQVDLPVPEGFQGPLTVTLRAHKFGYGEITKQVTLTVDPGKTGSVGGLFTSPPEGAEEPAQTGLSLFTGPVKWVGLVLLAGALAVAVIVMRRRGPAPPM